MTTDILGPARHVIGSTYVETVKPYILELTGLLRVVGPNEMATREMANDRVFITVDEHGCINGLNIG